MTSRLFVVTPSELASLIKCCLIPWPKAKISVSQLWARGVATCLGLISLVLCGIWVGKGED